MMNKIASIFAVATFVVVLASCGQQSAQTETTETTTEVTTTEVETVAVSDSTSTVVSDTTNVAK
jgi:PBP1b-binding outer membrane lipoprotein LpoB